MCCFFSDFLVRAATSNFMIGDPISDRPDRKKTSAGGIFRSDARAFADDEVLRSQSTWLSSTWIYYWLPSMCSFSETWSFLYRSYWARFRGEETWRVVWSIKERHKYTYVYCHMYLLNCKFDIHTESYIDIYTYNTHYSHMTRIWYMWCMPAITVVWGWVHFLQPSDKNYADFVGKRGMQSLVESHIGEHKMIV